MNGLWWTRRAELAGRVLSNKEGQIGQVMRAKETMELLRASPSSVRAVVWDEGPWLLERSNSEEEASAEGFDDGRG